MKRYAFTGPSVLNYEQMEFVDRMVGRLNPPPSEITTGGASGVDSIVLSAALGHWPSAHHRLVIPAAPWNEALLETIEASGMVEVIRMPWVNGSDEADRRRRAYRARNERMCDHADELQAFLRSLTKYRSGELMTMNIAEKRSIPIVRYLLP